MAWDRCTVHRSLHGAEAFDGATVVAPGRRGRPPTTPNRCRNAGTWQSRIWEAALCGAGRQGRSPLRDGATAVAPGEVSGRCRQSTVRRAGAGAPMPRRCLLQAGAPCTEGVALRSTYRTVCAKNEPQPDPMHLPLPSQRQDDPYPLQAPNACCILLLLLMHYACNDRAVEPVRTCQRTWEL